MHMQMRGPGVVTVDRRRLHGFVPADGDVRGIAGQPLRRGSRHLPKRSTRGSVQRRRLSSYPPRTGLSPRRNKPVTGSPYGGRHEERESPATKAMKMRSGSAVRSSLARWFWVSVGVASVLLVAAGVILALLLLYSHALKQIGGF